MRIFLSALLAVCLLAPANAAAAPPAESESSSGPSNRLIARFNLFGGDDDDDGYGEEEEVRDDPREISMPAIVAPLQVDGRLTGFAYVTIGVRLRDGANVWQARENAHYALDRMVRAAYRHSISNETGDAVDEERAIAVWSEVLAEYYGANVLEYIEVRGADTRMLQR